jgi:hypothetical protein
MQAVVPEVSARRQGPQGRRAGYVIAAVINLAVCFLANVSPGWQVVPFLTDATADLLPLFNLVVLAQVAANLAYAVFDSTGLRRVLEVPLTALSLALAIRVLVVFPFAFDVEGLTVLARFIAWIALIGTFVALIVNTVLLIRWIVDRATS